MAAARVGAAHARRARRRDALLALRAANFEAMGDGAQPESICLRECEATRRAAGRCPFDDGSPGELHAFCAHQRRCVVCDGGAFALCEPCNLARGDGEAVASLVEERQIDVLFCDFDRTLCTTKSGASPLQSKRVTHSIDADLAAAAALARRAYVVTRNSHRADILLSRRAGRRFDDVVVVQKKKSKATEIAPRLAPGERGLFVDDDVRVLRPEGRRRARPHEGAVRAR